MLLDVISTICSSSPSENKPDRSNVMYVHSPCVLLNVACLVLTEKKKEGRSFFR